MRRSRYPAGAVVVPGLACGTGTFAAEHGLVDRNRAHRQVPRPGHRRTGRAGGRAPLTAAGCGQHARVPLGRGPHLDPLAHEAVSGRRHRARRADGRDRAGIVGLVGSNGAGKSTLLKILLGLIDATSGEATVFDLDVRTRGTDIRQFVGYMPEHDCLPPDASATDFVSHLALMSGLPRTAARERTAEVLRHVGLYEERYRAIGGYSTGMKQRVKLAQALVHDPRLLLLDEPTNGLDPAGRDEMLELVRRTGTEFGIAVIVASHLLGEIERVCDYLVAIEGGRLLRAAPLGVVHRADRDARRRGRGGERRAGRAADRAGSRGDRRRPRGPHRAHRRAAVRHRPRHDRRAGPAARPDRAAPPQARGPVPRRAASRAAGASGRHAVPPGPSVRRRGPDQ